MIAIWPEPVDHDECFTRAGFRGFADSDETWNSQFQVLLDRVVQWLSSYGSPVVSGGEVAPPGPVHRLLGKKAPVLRPSERLALVAHDDQFGPCSVRFGAPARAVACTTDGHPIVWVWLRDTDGERESAQLDALSKDKPLVETRLDWDPLGPPTLFTRA